MAIVRWTFTACLQRLQRKCPPDLRVALTARRNALPVDQLVHELALSRFVSKCGQPHSVCAFASRLEEPNLKKLLRFFVALLGLRDGV